MLIGICFWRPRDDPAAGHLARPTGCAEVPRAAPATQVRPRPGDAGEYLTHQTRLSSGNKHEGL
jgi:hypothetical protein